MVMPPLCPLGQDFNIWFKDHSKGFKWLKMHIALNCTCLNLQFLIF